jgi:hypothetical protein
VDARSKFASSAQNHENYAPKARLAEQLHLQTLDFTALSGSIPFYSRSPDGGCTYGDVFAQGKP